MQVQAEHQTTFLFSCEGARDTEARVFIVYSGASMHNAEQGHFSSETIDTLRRSKNTRMRLTATRNSANKRVSTSFYDLDLFVTVQLLDKTPAVLLLYVFFSKRGFSYEWKTAKLYYWPEMGRQLFVQWTTQYFSLHQDCHHIPAAFCLQHRDERISLIIPENWDHYQIP